MPRLHPFYLSLVDPPVIEYGSGQQATPGGEGWLIVRFLESRDDETDESTIARDVWH